MEQSGNNDRRASLRLDMEKQQVSVTWSEDGAVRQKELTCFDVSGGGFSLEMEFPLPVGTEVVVCFQVDSPDAKRFEAKVLRVCQLEHGWFTIGCQFTK